MRTRNLIYGCLVVFCVLRAASAQTRGLNIMSATDVGGDEGESVTVSVLFDHPDPVQGWTVVLCHDPRQVALEEVRLGRDLLPLQPDFVNTEMLASGFRVGVILSLAPEDSPLAPGRGQEAHSAVYRLVGEGAITTPLEFCTITPGGQTFENVFVVGGRSVGVDDGLILNDGSIAIYSPECPRNFDCRPDQIAKTVELTWEVPTLNTLVGYEIKRNGAIIATVLSPGMMPSEATSFTDTTARGVRLRNTPLNYELVALFPEGEKGSCTPLRCRTSLSPSANVLFADGLDYTDDDELQAAGFRIVDENEPVPNASWTVTNPTGGPNPSGLDGRPTRGGFLSSDFGLARGMNEPGSGASYELWSPAFDCSGQETVWLHFDTTVSLNREGTGAFDVDVTVNDGASWINVFRRVSSMRMEFSPVAEFGSTGGLFGRVDIDLSEPVANQPAVRFRLRHFEPTDSLVAVDNFVVDDDPPPHLRIPDGVMGIQAILPEPTALLLFDTVDFAPPVGIPTVADNWAVLSLAGNSGNDSWTADDPGVRSALNAGAGTEYQGGNGLYNLDGFFSIMDSLNAGNLEEDEYMITKPVDCGNLCAVYLVFDEEIFWFDVRQEVLLSLDGGNSFECEPVLSYAGTADEAGVCDPEPRLLQEFVKYHETRSIQVPLAAGQEDVAFAFHYESEGQEGWWAVDNVTLYGIPRNAQFIRGDVDCNGTVNISDPIFLLAYLFSSGAAPCCLEAADVAKEGRVNLSSSVYTLSFLFGGGSAPPAPFPACGSAMPPEGCLLGCAAYPPCEP